jgi:predicted HTH transcriptional regulator
VLVEAAIMREEGEGIPRMFEEMEQAFLKPPTLAVEDATFRVTLHNEPVFAGPSPEWQRVVQQLPLSVAQQRILLAKPDGFTNEDYRRLNGVDRDQAYREIQDMVAKHVILPPDGHGRGATYRLAPELYSARTWLDDRLSRLRAHFESNERLTNTDYRALFGVNRYAAIRELRRLVDEGRLQIVGERRGARYLPGPSLRVLPEK